jgi:hypothetical protein
MKETQFQRSGSSFTAAVLAEISFIPEDVVYIVCHPRHF